VSDADKQLELLSEIFDCIVNAETEEDIENCDKLAAEYDTLYGDASVI
jgi:hypothetical protein